VPNSISRQQVSLLGLWDGGEPNSKTVNEVDLTDEYDDKDIKNLEDEKHLLICTTYQDEFRARAVNSIFTPI